MFFNTSWLPMLAQSSSVIALIRAGTSWVGLCAAAEGGRKCKRSEGAGERAVHTINHVLQAGQKKKRPEWGDRPEENGGTKRQKLSF